MSFFQGTIGIHLEACLLIMSQSLYYQQGGAEQTDSAGIFFHPLEGQACVLLLLLLCEVEMTAQRRSGL